MTSVRTAIAVMAFMTFAVFMIVMMTFRIGIIVELISKVILYHCICITIYSRQQLDSNFLQRNPRTHSDSATDQCLNLCCTKKSRKRTVTGSVGINDL